MVLLAVGDIFDDAKAVLIQIAQSKNADYLIVDATDVARLFIAYGLVCPVDGTPFAEGRCPKCGMPAEKPVELSISVMEELRYDLA